MDIRKYISIFFTICIITSCLELQTNDAYDSNGDYWGGYTLNEWLVSERNLNCHIFAKAVEMTGMGEIFDTIAPSTVIVPNDVAFAQLFSEIGVVSIEDFEPVILKELLSYLVMSQRYVSTDMTEGSVIAAQNLNEKPLYLSLKASSGNRLQLYVNNHVPEGVQNFAATKATVVMQDVIFKDHVAQIVSNVPYFKEYTLHTDTYNGAPNTDQIFEIPVEADTYLFTNLINSRADVMICCNSERIPMFLYDDQQSISFYDELSVAKVKFHIPRIDGFISNPFVIYDITDQIWSLTEQGTDVPKFYNSVYRDFVPEISADKKVATFDVGNVGEWTSVDITDYIIRHYKEPSPRPIAFTVVPANTFYSSTGILYFGYKKESNGDVANKPSYIQVLGRMDSRIQLQKNVTLKCEESVVITRNELLCSAPVVPDGLVYSPQNITYRIQTEPSAGVLTRNCLPLSEGDVFTQNEINEGAIKYYKTRTSDSDTFVLKAGDYTGASLPEPVTMNVTF